MRQPWRRSELAAAQIGTNRYGYAYDTIGNRIWSCANAFTNSYSANSLNQYTSFLRDSVSPCELVYDADGNLVRDNRFAYTYDAENRMLSARPIAPSEGDLAVVNAYDHKHRRVMKRVERCDGDEWQTSETHAFTYDGCNIVLEQIAFADGTTRICEYFWGNDLAGTEQGAGGVGGLIAVSIDGAAYIPCYDNNGNITRYLDANGMTVAAYTYDAFGRTISQSGSLADVFRHRFSTKYFDGETGLFYYGYRFYHPVLARWLTRDPIEESGGLDLYTFCGNNAMSRFDADGRAHFEVRKLSGMPGVLNYSCFGAIIGWGPALVLDLGLADKLNIEILHEHLFYDDGTNVGYNKTKEFSETSHEGYYRRDTIEYDDCVMKEAQKRVPKPPYSLLGIGAVRKYNCQDYADSLRNEYNKILNDKEVLCKCKNRKK